jgi:hypothetical protein
MNHTAALTNNQESCLPKVGIKTGPAAPLTFHFLVAQFEKAFAIPAFLFPIACVLLHVLFKSNTDDAYYQAGKNRAVPEGVWIA